MEYIQATGIHLDDVFDLAQDTIRSVYPCYYPKEIADFFCAHHSKETIQADIDSANVWVLFEGDILVGSGSRRDNNITRLYVAPAFQGKGYGGIIMQKLEDEIGVIKNTILISVYIRSMKVLNRNRKLAGTRRGKISLQGACK
jgi:GNAT superfamily N-acetyltransferase